eukprot:867092-Pelagomonas_calceolata.AAC.1
MVLNVTAFPFIFLHRCACSRAAVPPPRVQLLPRPCVFTVFNFDQVYVPLVHTHLMRLSNVGTCVGPQWGAIPAA